MVSHHLQVERRTRKVRQSETDVLPLCHATWLCFRFIPRGESINPDGSFGGRPASNATSSATPHAPDYLALFLEFSRDDARFDSDPPTAGQWVTGLKFQNPEPWFGKQAVNAVSMSCKRRPSHQQNDYPFVINHDAIESLPLSYRPLGVIRKTDHGRVVDITCIPTTCCGEIFLSPQCRNCSRDPDHAHKIKTSHGRPVYKI